jgi:hypothetical protein
MTLHTPLSTDLDDAAQQALATHSIDYASLLRRAQERSEHEQRRLRAVSRRRTGLSALAVAAVVALIAVLVPSSGVLRGDAGPAGQVRPVPSVTGLPGNWYSAPEWTPPVTRHPMAAAVMVLSTPLETGLLWHRWRGRGPVLVSADARTYASLPGWGPYDGGVALSPDGTKVAWWTAGEKDGDRLTPAVVHLLTLRNGTQHDVVLDRLTPRSMIWRSGEVYVSGRASTDRGPRGTYRISADGRTRTKVCGCAPEQLGTDGDERLKQSEESQGNAISAAAPFEASRLDPAAETVGGRIAAPALVASWDGFRSASLLRGANGAWVVQLRTSVIVDSVLPAQDESDSRIADRDILLAAAEPITSAKLLAWTTAGIVVQVNTSQGPGYPAHRSVRIMDPETGASRVVSRPIETSVPVPVVVAAGLITSTQPITAAPPSFDVRDRAHLAFLVRIAWWSYGGWIKAGLVLLLVGAWLVIGLRGRRRLSQSP